MLKMLAPALVASLALATAATAQDVSLTAGRRLAAAQCGRCHSVDAEGTSPNPRSPPFRTLGAKFPFDGLKDAMTSGMIVGHPEMPIIHLSPVEAGDLTAYLKTLQPAEQPRRRSRPRPSVTPAT